MKKKSKANRINVVTLGCSKNVVDSEHVMAQLEAAGYEVVFDSNDNDAATVVINTCGFIGDAKEESINTILQFVQAKSEGLIDRLFVIGCLSERYADELRAEIPEVDDYFGARDFRGIVERLAGAWRPELATARHLTTPAHYAYLKISEGCNWRCAYCAIPLIRGGHVSVPMEQVVREAEELARGGVKELIVVAQDTTFYGVDLYGERKLAELLRRLAAIDGVEWIRLHYTYPTGFPQEVIDVMRNEPKVCRYIDIPLQHIADTQLSAMRRGITKERIIALLDRLRREVPGIAIRTTLMVGFPGETEADFAELEEFVREQRFDRLGVFPYSAEEGTPSAEMADDVPEEVKQARVERIMKLQQEISLQNNLRRVGETYRVIVDRREGDFYVARTEFDSPEVDEEILIPAAGGTLHPGEFRTVRITDAEEYDLYGELVAEG
ncbi:MAG TPA: 30S ribosomal protein S12 methylthiotransferase RimO [Candidatus Tidjanibacter faecipullorum]|uniref:Ribosomal protein uS12 methylthiotransferase RimO n=1 Tax=Candidatus Tidjanibacter faecipullorum TaxID=2838766 RepID=A0A9D2DCV0_9BACT|nr:30S ribosomal protein S12 methylthiotransferase RimO [Candidatus Tidjanibacter faecipullorum]